MNYTALDRICLLNEYSDAHKDAFGARPTFDEMDKLSALNEVELRLRVHSLHVKISKFEADYE